MHFQYVKDEESDSREDVVAKILFDARCFASAARNYVSTGLSLLDDTAHENTLACELISSNGAPVNQGHTEDFYWAETGDYLLVAYWANEATAGGLRQATESIYNRLLIEIQTRAFPFLVRAWNYFADINGIDENDGLERYRQFCIGRFDAFAAQGIAENQFPSACALGHHGGDLLIYALASKTAAQHFENPQQASAYHYPAEYGPRSPSFARASLLEPAGQMAKLFVSGTASVVGFVTRHPDDLNLQIQVTLENLDCLLAHIGAEYASTHDGIKPTLEAEVIKIYVRNPDDITIIKDRISKAYPAAPAIYLAADICRSDLLLEVDGIWNLVE